jgi:hypothetical protein
VVHRLPKKDPRAKNALFLECLLRVCSRFRVEDFYVNVARGYYGEEVKGIQLEDETPIAEFLLQEGATGWVEFYLTREYGYVLDTLQGLNWTIEEMDLDQVRILNDYRKLDLETITGYREKLTGNKDALLSCLTNADLGLADGYHRYRASVEEGKKRIWVIHPT